MPLWVLLVFHEPIAVIFHWSVKWLTSITWATCRFKKSLLKIVNLDLHCMLLFALLKAVTTGATANAWTWSISPVWDQRSATSQSTSWISAQRLAWTSRTTDVQSAAHPSPSVSTGLSLLLPWMQWPHLSPIAYSTRGSVLSHHNPSLNRTKVVSYSFTSSHWTSGKCCVFSKNRICDASFFLSFD